MGRFITRLSVSIVVHHGLSSTYRYNLFGTAAARSIGYRRKFRQSQLVPFGGHDSSEPPSDPCFFFLRTMCASLPQFLRGKLRD
jgi:hypothetical protein